MNLSEQSAKLLEALRQLQSELSEHTMQNWTRINPFCEDLFDWKERGRYWLKQDKNVTIYNTTIIQGDVEIGADAFVGPYCGLDGTGGLKIGRNCSLAAGVYIHTHDSVRWAVSGGQHAYEYKPVTIGDCCFLGVRAIVLPGVTIGKHCVIAAGAVVTGPIADYTIAAGVPARPIGHVVVQPDGQIELCYDRTESL